VPLGCDDDDDEEEEEEIDLTQLSNKDKAVSISIMLSRQISKKITHSQ
jgi:hypothetical protein